jgi:hypothetical protein
VKIGLKNNQIFFSSSEGSMILSWKKVKNSGPIFLSMGENLILRDSRISLQAGWNIEEDVYNCRLLLFALFSLRVMIDLEGQLKWFSTFDYRGGGVHIGH